MTPEQVVAVKFSKDATSLLFTIFRILATRKLPRTRQKTWANIFLFLTFACDFTSTAVFVYIMFEQRKIMDDYEGDMLRSDAEISRPDLGKVFFASILMYFVSLYCLKAAWLSYYAQLFINTDTKKRYSLYAGTAVTAVCFIIGLFFHFLWCRPFTDNWNPMTTNPSCPGLFNFEAFAAISALNIISDIAVILVPVVVISSLRLNTRERLGLIVVFLVGGSSIISSIVRFGVVGRLLHDKVYTWNTTHIFALLSHAEVLFGIVAFSLPAFRRFIRAKSSRKYAAGSGGSDQAHMQRGSGSGRRTQEMDTIHSWKTEAYFEEQQVQGRMSA